MGEAFTVAAHKYDNIHPGSSWQGVELADVGGLGKICPFEKDNV